jgi:integrase
MAPRFRVAERPPRTLPGQDVRRILKVIRRSEPPGKRDFAMLLLLATYGLGAAEVLNLRLEDLDWQAGILRACRPKTKVRIELPSLPAVAKALTAYLRWERSPAKGTVRLFLSKRMPYDPITSGAIRHRIRLYAGQAGLSTKVIGAHAFRQRRGQGRHRVAGNLPKARGLRALARGIDARSAAARRRWRFIIGLEGVTASGALERLPSFTFELRRR